MVGDVWRAAFRKSVVGALVRYLPILLMVLVPGATLCSAATLNSPVVTPSTIAAGVATTATFTVSVSDPTVQTSGLNLQRLDPASNSYVVVGNLYDDGTHGDAVSGDHVFSLQVPLNEAKAATLTFRTSAAVTGKLTRVFSTPIVLTVTAASPVVITPTVNPAPNASGWNTTPVTVTFACKGGAAAVTSCPAPITVSTSGANQIVKGTAKDAAGNTASAQAIVNLELTAPKIVAQVTPAPNAAGWNNTPATVSFVCTASTSPIVSCSPPVQLTTEVSAELETGTVTDVAGASVNASVVAKVDLTPPTVNILLPTNGATIALSSTSIGVSGTVGDNSSGIASVTCNGVPGSVSKTSFTCTEPLTPGVNSFTVLVKDVAGNTASAPLQVTYAPAPILKIVSPLSNIVTNISPVTVNGTISDPSSTLTINGIAVPHGSGTFSMPVPLVEGLNTLSAVATNAKGITTTSVVQVTLDTTPPHVVINSPAQGTTTTAASLSVSGLANDVVVGTVNSDDVQVTVNGVAAQVANRSFSAANIPIALGLNTIRATGRDKAGNSITTMISVTRVAANQPPTPAVGKAVQTQWLNVISGNNQSGVVGSTLTSPIVVSLTDTNGKGIPSQTVVFQVTSNNGLVSAGGAAAMSATTVTTDNNGQAKVQWTLGQRSGSGNNMLEASTPLAVTPVDFTATGTTGAATMVVADSGNNQVGILGQPLPFPLVVDVVDAGHNRIAGVPVVFTVKKGGGSVNGATSVAITSDSNGRALVTFTTGVQQGINNNIVEATFTGNKAAPAAFVATAKAPGNPTDTTISGVVLDNSNLPIQGVTINLYKTNQGNANNLPVQVGNPVQTDAKGAFLIDNAPVGFFKLMADGTTAQGTKAFPPIEYDIVTVAGTDNTVGMPIYLPALDTVNKICVDETHGGTLTLPQYPGFALTILPGSATFPGGSRSGCVTATPVNGDKVPMAPGFGQQPRFITTIQPVGTMFNPPAPLTLPNVDGLKPNAVTEMYSYDHDLSMFVAIGTGTVTPDGSQIVSDAGVGVLKAGWHCGGDPNATGSAGTCPECNKCTGSDCGPDSGQDGKVSATNKCLACKEGSLEKIEIDETKMSNTIKFTPPNEAVSQLNEALTGLRAFGVLAEVKIGEVSGQLSTQQCCSPETGVGMKTTGSVGGNFGSFSVKAKIYPPGPIPSVEKEFNIGSADITVEAIFVGGVFLGLEGKVSGTVGYHKSDCAENEAEKAGCFYGNLTTALTASLNATIGGKASLKCSGTCLGINEVSGAITANLGNIQVPFNISQVAYNSADDCTSGLHGGVAEFDDVSFTISAKVEAELNTGIGTLGYEKEFEFLSCKINHTTGAPSCE